MRAAETHWSSNYTHLNLLPFRANFRAHFRLYPSQTCLNTLLLLILALAHQLYPIGVVPRSHIRLYYVLGRPNRTSQASDHWSSVHGWVPRVASWYRQSIHCWQRQRRSGYRRNCKYLPLLGRLLHVVRTGQLDLPVRDLPHELARDGNVCQYRHQLGRCCLPQISACNANGCFAAQQRHHFPIHAGGIEEPRVEILPLIRRDQFEQ